MENEDKDSKPGLERSPLPAQQGGSRHTPGPWKSDMHGRYVLACDNEMMICNVRGWGYLTGVGGLNLPEGEAVAIQDANTRLIAAAPAMYEAITDALNTMEIQEQRESGAFHLSIKAFRPMWDEAKEKCRAALATVEEGQK